MHKELALVVVGSASPDGAVVNLRLKRVAVPLFKGFGRLDVVMTINKDGFGIGRKEFLAVNHWFSFGWVKLGLVGTGLEKQLGKTFCTALAIGLIGLFCAH